MSLSEAKTRRVTVECLRKGQAASLPAMPQAQVAVADVLP